MRFGALLVALFAAQLRPPAPPRFEKVSDHYYHRSTPDGGPNVGALVTDDGILLVDPPGETAVPAMLDALRRVSARPIRWIASTGAAADDRTGIAYFQARDALLLTVRDAKRGGPPPAAAGEKPAWRAAFGRQMHLFPGGVEVRLLAVEKAHTAADLVLLLPGERVLQVGPLFTPHSFPEIDVAAGGTAVGWLEGVRQVIDGVPLLRSAMPAAKTAGPPGKAPSPPPTKAAAAAKSAAPPKPPEERPLEELVVVIPGRGPLANLADLKELAETAQRLRGEIARGISSGRNRDAFLAAIAVPPYRDYREHDAFAARLFDELARK
jgi:glyoxylase-like metal-dependent hydrolase (beta-lactamase superfamily II)